MDAQKGFIYQSDQSQTFPGLGMATCWGLGAGNSAQPNCGELVS